MYNGIGLATARGSGTNGYVQRNWAAIKKVKDQTSFKTEEELAKIDSAANRQPNQELLDHDRKRKVELKCIELEQSLEDQGYILFDEYCVDINPMSKDYLLFFTVFPKMKLSKKLILLELRYWENKRIRLNMMNVADLCKYKLLYIVDGYYSLLYVPIF